MSYKSILAIVRIDNAERELRDAVDLCMDVDAHLSVLAVQLASPPPMGDAVVVSSIWFEERERQKAGLDAYVDKIKDIVSTTGISYSVEGKYAETASAGDELGMRARYSDLTFIGSDVQLDRDLYSAAIDGCHFNSARPVILAPGGGAVSLRPAKVMIAWDSSLEASVAVRAALDPISQAERVHVVVVDPNTGARNNGDEPGADIARYLLRHSDSFNEMIGIVAFAGQHGAGLDAFDKFVGQGDVVALSGRADEAYRQAKRFRRSMDFRAQSAARPTQALGIRPLFACVRRLHAGGRARWYYLS